MNLAFVLLLSFCCVALLYFNNSIQLFVSYEWSVVSSVLTIHNSLFTILMFKVSHPCHHHRQFIFHTIINRIFIPYRAPGLYERFYSFFMAHLYTIIKREECITC